MPKAWLKKLGCLALQQAGLSHYINSFAQPVDIQRFLSSQFFIRSDRSFLKKLTQEWVFCLLAYTLSERLLQHVKPTIQWVRAGTRFKPLVVYVYSFGLLEVIASEGFYVFRNQTAIERHFSQTLAQARRL